jgi:hypothetical protein
LPVEGLERLQICDEFNFVFGLPVHVLAADQIPPLLAASAAKVARTHAASNSSCIRLYGMAKEVTGGDILRAHWSDDTRLSLFQALAP